MSNENRVHLNRVEEHRLGCVPGDIINIEKVPGCSRINYQRQFLSDRTVERRVASVQTSYEGSFNPPCCPDEYITVEAIGAPPYRWIGVSCPGCDRTYTVEVTANEQTKQS